MSKIPLSRLAMLQFPLAILGGVAGYFLLLRGEEMGDIDEKVDAPFRTLISSIWPVVLVVSATLLGVPFPLALLGSLVCVTISYRLYSSKQWRQWLTIAVQYKTISMVAGIFFFRHAIECTGLATTLPKALSTLDVPVLFVVGAIPFIVGLLVGIAVGMVGISLPVIAPLIMSADGTLQAPLVMWAYVCGFAGMMLSPSHLCLVLSQQYFEARWSKLFLLLVPLCAIVVSGTYLLLQWY